LYHENLSPTTLPVTLPLALSSSALRCMTFAADFLETDLNVCNQLHLK
jgi:hypothetical protein